MSTKSKTPKKSTAATPRVVKSSKTTSNASVVQSPKLSSPPDKKPTQNLKPLELQAEPNVSQGDLKKAKEKLALVEREKVKALEEVKEANKKLKDALVAQKLAEENSKIEKSRADEIEQAGIKAAQKKEEEWQKELEAMRNQNALDVAALLSAKEELQRVKQELAINCESKNQGLSHADDAANIASLNEKVGLLEMSMARQKGDLEELEHRAKEEASEMAKKIESLMSELETVKEEKNQAIENEKLAEERAQTLLEGKNKLRNDLESFKEEEAKSKQAIESLTSALHEVSSEARDVKETLLASQAAHRQCESQIEDLKLVLQTTNEKYENMLDETKEKIDVLTDSVEQSKDEHQRLKAKWEEKELHLMICVKENEDRNSSMEKEINRLADLLKQAEEEADHLKNSLKEAESEMTYLKEVLDEAKGESMRLNDCLMDKETKVESILQENEDLRIREAASLKKVEDLSKLLEEAQAKKEAEENGELSECEKDYDMLPKVVEFSEENGGVGVEDPEVELLHLSDQPLGVTPKANIISQDESIQTSMEDEISNGKLNESAKKEKEDDSSLKAEYKMWESCTIGHEDLSAEREAEQEGKSEPKADVGESSDQINRLPSAENLENGSTSPTKPQIEKKKKPLFHTFGSLLKRKSSSSQK